jgi:hypothetical protein
VGTRRSGSGKPTNREAISQFTVTPPEDFDHLAAMTDEEKLDYVKQVLNRSEDEAVREFIAPIAKRYSDFGHILAVYRPIIEYVRRHFSHVGRPKTDPKTGRPTLTWNAIVEAYFPVGRRRIEQLLAAPKEIAEPKPKMSEPQARGMIREFVALLTNDSNIDDTTRLLRSKELAEYIKQGQGQSFAVQDTDPAIANFQTTMLEADALLRNEVRLWKAGTMSATDGDVIMQQDIEGIPASTTVSALQEKEHKLGLHLTKLKEMETKLAEMRRRLHKHISKGEERAQDVQNALKRLQATGKTKSSTLTNND